MSANRSTGGGVKNWRQQTRMVRGGLARSGFEETAEAIYMTSGYVYQSAEEAEAADGGLGVIELPGARVDFTTSVERNV